MHGKSVLYLMKKILLICFFICLFKYLPATTIVIYITPDFVIMAADSKAVYTNAKTLQQTSGTVPKIYKSGNIYFSLAGLTLNEIQLFDVAKISGLAFKNTGNINAAIKKIKVAVGNALLNYLTNQKKNNPELFKNNLTAEKFITSIGIVSLKNNKPYTHLIGFMVTDAPQIKIRTEEDEYASGSKRDAVYYLGTSAEINRYINTIRSNNLEPVRFVEKLMNLQISKTPDLVSPPIDIIKITPKETIWVRRKKGTPVEFE